MFKNAKVLTLTLFVFLFFNLYSQGENDPEVKFNKETPKFRFGLHFSPNISWLELNTSGYKRGESRFGFAYGLSTEFFLAKNYLISTGFNINSVGGDMIYEGVFDNSGIAVPTEIEEDIKINYIDIPLKLKLRTNEIGYMTYYGTFGFVAGIRYNSKADYEYTNQNGLEKNDIDNTDNVTLFNMNLVVGAGAEYNLSGNTNIMFGVSYHNGFVDMLKGKVHALDATGKALVGTDGKAIYTEKEVSSTISFFSIDLGIYF